MADSEAVYFENFRKACLANDPVSAMRDLVFWLNRIATYGPASLQQLVKLGDSELKTEIKSLESRLFGNSGKSEGQNDPWSGRNIYHAVKHFRKRSLGGKGTAKSHKNALLPDLNPGQAT